MSRNTTVLFAAACALALAACDQQLTAPELAPNGPNLAEGVSKDTPKTTTPATAPATSVPKSTPAPAPAPTPAPTPAPAAPTAGATASTSGMGMSYSVAQPAMPYELPVNRSLASTGKSWPAADSKALLAAIAAAVPGDEILLTPGQTYVGLFKLPTKTQTSGFITIRTDLPLSSLPGGTTRVTPQIAASLRFAKLVAQGRNDPVIDLAPGARGWRLAALEITASPTELSLSTIVRLGDGSATTIAQTPSDIVLDRLYIHGTPTMQNIRCVLANAARTAIINSTINECHAKGMDSNAIGVTTSPGPLLFENNSLQGAGMGIFIGGADPRIQGLIPSDIVVRGNHVWRPASWKGTWTVKNLLEFKNARRALVEQNLFENNWIDGQAGMAINFKAVNQYGKAPWSTTSDVTFRYNVVRNSPSGITLAAAPEQYPAVFAARIKIENNLFYNIGTYNGTSSGRMLGMVGPLSDVQLLSNTMSFDAVGGAMGAVMDPTSKGQANGFIARYNIAATGSNGWIGSGVAAGEAALKRLWGAGYDFTDNVMIGQTSSRAPYPATTVFSTLTNVGFTNPLSGDFSLLAGALGTRHGADMTVLTKVLANVN